MECLLVFGARRRRRERSKEFFSFLGKTRPVSETEVSEGAASSGREVIRVKRNK